MPSEDAPVATTETQPAETGETEPKVTPETPPTPVAQPEGEEKPEGTGSSIDSLEDALKEISRLRKENASRRVQGKEIEEAALKWKEHLDSQKSELEKLTDRAKELAEENRVLKTQKTQADLAKEFGLDDDLAEFIVGSNLEEMKTKAETLAARLKPKKTPATASGMRAGEGRQQPTGTQDAGAKFFNDLLKG